MYPASLLIWIQIKPYYGLGLTKAGCYLSALTMGCLVKKINAGEEDAKVRFIYPVLSSRGMYDLAIDIELSVSKYSFNVPLSIALIATLFPIFHWKKISMLEAVFILACVHLLYIYL